MQYIKEYQAIHTKLNQAAIILILMTYNLNHIINIIALRTTNPKSYYINKKLHALITIDWISINDNNNTMIKYKHVHL